MGAPQLVMCMRRQRVSSLSHSWTTCQMFALKCGASCGALAHSLTSCDHLTRACGVPRAGLVRLYACQLSVSGKPSRWHFP